MTVWIEVVLLLGESEIPMLPSLPKEVRGIVLTPAMGYTKAVLFFPPLPSVVPYGNLDTYTLASLSNTCLAE